MKKIQLFLTLCTMSSLSFASSIQRYNLPVDTYGYTSMHHAVLHNDTITIKVLATAFPNEVNRPSEYDATKQQTFKDTPAHIAAFHGKWDALTTLIALGANLTYRNIKDNTPIDNVLTKEYQKYQSAFNKGTLLRKDLLKRKTNSIATQTECLQQVSTSSQTNLEKLYQDPMANCPPSYKTTINIFPPCYVSPPPYQATLSLNPTAKPYVPTKSLLTIQLDSPDEIWSTTPYAPQTAQSPTFPTIPEIELEHNLNKLLMDDIN